MCVPLKQAPQKRLVSAYPSGLALDLLAVEGGALDHAVGPVLEAEEVERRIRVISPSPCCWRAKAQDRPFLHVDDLAVHEELPSATDEDVNLVVVLVPVQERNPLTGGHDVQGHLQARRPQQVAQEQLASG